MKKIILLICLMIFPLNIKAAEVVINIECDKTVASPGDTVLCTISGNVTNGEIEGVETTITTSSESQLIIDDIDVDNKVWANAGTYPTFGLLTSVNKTGAFEMMTVTLKVSNDVSGGTVLKVNAINNNFTLSTNEEIKISDVSKEIRVVSSINTLSSLTISNGTLNPTFDKDILSYSATVNNEQITISATPTDSNSTVTGDTGTKSLSYGLNTFKIYVKSEFGETKTYTLSITREKPADTRDKDNTISSLTVNNQSIELKSDVYEYTYQVESDVTKATVKAVLNSSKATFLDNSGTQNVTLKKEITM